MFVQEPLKGLMNMNDTAEYVGSSVLILQRKKKKLLPAENGERGQTVPADVWVVCGWYLRTENESKTRIIIEVIKKALSCVKGHILFLLILFLKLH